MKRWFSVILAVALLCSAMAYAEDFTLRNGIAVGIVVILLLLIVVTIFIADSRLEGSEENEIKQRVINTQNPELEQKKKQWNQKAAKLGVDLNTPVVRMHFINSNSTYDAYHIWVNEAGALCFFPAAPTLGTQHFECYQYPENLCIKSEFVRRCYRTGSQGVRYVADPVDASDVDAKLKLAKFYEGYLKGVLYANEARKAAKNATVRTIYYDNRRTIIESETGDVIEFTIDAFYVFQRVIPDKC